MSYIEARKEIGRKCYATEKYCEMWRRQVIQCCQMNNTCAYGMVRLKPSANTNVFYISLFIKHVYRAIPPLLEYPWPYFKRQLTGSHSFSYHGHLGRPHTGGTTVPLYECTNSRTHFHSNWYCRIKKKKISSSLNSHLYRTTITSTSHEHLQAFLRMRTSPALLAAIASALSAYAFAFTVCAHVQIYRARSVALLPGHE